MNSAQILATNKKQNSIYFDEITVGWKKITFQTPNGNRSLFIDKQGGETPKYALEVSYIRSEQENDLFTIKVNEKLVKFPSNKKVLYLNNCKELVVLSPEKGIIRIIHDHFQLWVNVNDGIISKTDQTSSPTISTSIQRFPN